MRIRKNVFQVEPGFFLALSVSVPSSKKQGKEGEQVRIFFLNRLGSKMSSFVQTISMNPVREVACHLDQHKQKHFQVEWRPEDVSDSVLLAVLQRAYDMFHLFQVRNLNSGFAFESFKTLLNAG